VPYRLLTTEEKAAMHEHEKAGGEFEFAYSEKWKLVSKPTWNSYAVYRTVPLPKRQDIIAWERLPAWVEWVARNNSGEVWAYDAERFYSYNGRRIRIDDWEMRSDIQAKVAGLWAQVNTENLRDISDFNGYQREFLRLFGFGLEGVDYGADVDPAVPIPSIA
jgi:hypothetical protein